MVTLKAYNEYLKKRIVHKDEYYYIEGYSGKYASEAEANFLFKIVNIVRRKAKGIKSPLVEWHIQENKQA